MQMVADTTEGCVPPSQLTLKTNCHFQIVPWNAFLIHALHFDSKGRPENF